MEDLSRSLKANLRHLSRTLRMPANAGIEHRVLELATSPPRQALLIWVDGLVAADGLARGVVAPLGALHGDLTPAALSRELLIQVAFRSHNVGEVVSGICNGHAALLISGWAEAWLLDVADFGHHHQGQAISNPNVEVFASDLRANLGLIRKRQRTPHLVARKVRLKNGKRGQVLLLYRSDRARPALIQRVHRWVRGHVGEEETARGALTGRSAVFGLLPRFSTSNFPDMSSLFLDNGHVLVLVDRVPYVCVAPVTAASFSPAPADLVRYPVHRWLARIRVVFYLTTLLLPGMVVSLMNYHHEMVPTTFLLSVASVRENAPFGVFFEVLLLEVLVEVSREASFRLPVSLPIGAAMLSVVLISLLAVLTGLVGPVPALAACAGTLSSLALPSYEGAYLVRTWRFYLLLAGTILGFFGMASVFGILLTYLAQARSWGVPFLGPSGWEFQNPEADAVTPPGSKGAKPRAKNGLFLR